MVYYARPNKQTSVNHAASSVHVELTLRQALSQLRWITHGTAIGRQLLSLALVMLIADQLLTGFDQTHQMRRVGIMHQQI